MTRLWRSRVVTLTVLLTVFALVAAACSPNEEEAVETSTTTSTTEATTTTTKPPETTTTEPKPQKPYGGEAIVADDEEPPTLNPYAPGGSKTIVSLIGQGYLTGVQDVDGYTLELIPEVVTELPTTGNGGVEVNDDTLSLDVIRQVVHGEGHYLRTGQTLELMRTEYEYPALADRSTPGEWEAEGSPDIRERAGRRVREILSTHYPEYIDPTVDRRIRDTFPILLPEEFMRPGNTRW